MAETLVSPGIALTEIDQSQVVARPLVAGAALVGPTVKGPINVPTKVTSYGEYVRTFGTTFNTKIDGSDVQQEFLTSLAAKSYFQQGGDSILVVRIANTEAFKPAKSTDVTALNTGSVTGSVFELETLSVGAYLNNQSGSAYAEDTASGALESGSADNIRFQVANVDTDKGTFSLIIRRGDDDAKDVTVLERFTDLSLDVNSDRYIARVIGDQKAVCVGTDADAYIKSEGNYPNNSAYVRVKSVKSVVGYNSSMSGSLPKEQNGGFYSASGVVGKCYDATGSEVTSSSAVYFQDIKAGSDYPQSVQYSDYSIAWSLLNNTDEYQINILSAPGLLDNDQINAMVDVAANRGDCIAVVDLSEFGTSVSQAANNATNVVSSYAATYWPWLQMYTSANRLEWVPASVVIPGVYAYNDKATAPWYAPAGMTRGGIDGVVQTERKLTKANRDTLYSKSVNPIATLPPAGIVIYGQKTLQKKASALDRVNVRRLLIEVKKKVKDMASNLLFENNTTALQASFKSQLDPYLASIVQRNGLYAYKVDLSGNTNDAIDRNEFHCAIYLQPTKVIEFIYLDFIVTATGVEFN